MVSMRLNEGGIVRLSQRLKDDLSARETGLQKPHIESLSDLAACALTCQSANSGKWKAILPRDVEIKSKERYISRFLSNEMIDPIGVMYGYVPELLTKASSKKKAVILMMDQSKVGDGFECLMVAMRVGERAIPVAWIVRKTEGEIGFLDQKLLLDRVLPMIPAGVLILLAADRFYGTAGLIAWCQRQGWKYRLRIKGNLILRKDGAEITGGDAARLKVPALIDHELNKTGVRTNIGILHEKGHKEPWIIAMDDVPNKGRVLDYGMRWGIEPMFSDFKSRGFDVTDTHLHHADRIERLILVLTIALYWAVSTGMQPQEFAGTAKKKPEVCSLSSQQESGPS